MTLFVPQMKYRLGPFTDVYAAFVGFPKDELDDMAVALKRNGGQIVEATSQLCTHIVSRPVGPHSSTPSSSWA